ncbi:MAG: T9SS type A sorting domain-containing protein [Candidatus Cloacimonetes bacterium]|nr:T9SS type A sorting domain-containing protein [Candidatus Cloacimonadota bacterium]
MKKYFTLLLVIIPLFILSSNDLPETRETGTWTGYVYNTETLEPVYQSTVYLAPHFPNGPGEYYTAWTDETGYFEFVNIEAANYDVRLTKWFYYDLNTSKIVDEGENTIDDFFLQKATGCNYTFYFIPDDYYYESTWSLYNEDEMYWYNGAPIGFNSDDSVREFLYLEPGNWTLVMYDSYGDGGLLCRCSDESGTIIFEDSCEGSLYEVPFFVPDSFGDFCDLPLPYLNVNDPALINECHGRQEIWYEFYLDNSYSDLTVSLLNSNFDTMLEVWADCDDAGYLAFNDNWQDQVEQSQIVFDNLSQGTYYAKIYSSDYEISGYYELEITGNLAQNYGDVDNNGIVEAFDASNVLQYVVQLDPVAVPLPWDEITLMRANVDGNEFIGAYDASLILQFVAGVIDIFPVELPLRNNEPVADVVVTFVDNELVFTAAGSLYGFSAEISTNIETPETDMRFAVNGNKIALASADEINGEFLRITVDVKKVTIYMVINNASEHLTLTSAPALTVLEGNYPNPFNPTTSITYAIAEDEDVNIQIFNVKGQLVTTLVNEHQAAGTYSLVWNADGQASGVYFFKMMSGRYTSTKKMILMK